MRIKHTRLNSTLFILKKPANGFKMDSGRVSERNIEALRSEGVQIGLKLGL